MTSPQINFARDIFNDFIYDYALFNESRYLVLKGGAGCLLKGTQVRMFDGSLKAVEDIKVSDKVMGVDSKPRSVLSVNNGTDMMYRVSQNKADDYIVNSQHILTLLHGKRIVDIVIGNYISLTEQIKRSLYGFKNNGDISSISISFNGEGELVVLMIKGWKTSIGVQAEIAVAEMLNKPIRYI